MVLSFRRKEGKAFLFARGWKRDGLQSLHQGKLDTMNTIGERGVWR